MFWKIFWRPFETFYLFLVVGVKISMQLYRPRTYYKKPFNGLMTLLIHVLLTFFRGGLQKGCSENMQQIYRRTPMPKCDFNKVAKQLRHECSPLNLLHIFRTPFLKSTSGWLLLWHYKGNIGIRHEKTIYEVKSTTETLT